MKIKLIAASLAVIGSSSAFAVTCGTPVATNATIPASSYIYVAGASAQSQAFNAVAKSLFDCPNDVVQVKADATLQDGGDIQKHVGYLGTIGGTNTLIVYHNNGGSGSGTLQLLAKTTAAPQVATSGNALTLAGASAVSGASGSYTATAFSQALKLPVIALQDVLPSEHSSLVTTAANSANYDALSVIKTPLPTGLQGFGIAVSAPLYSALQAAQGTTGQPSVRRSDYASLTNINGSIKTAADLLRNTDAGTLEIARRVGTSGTQASSELFFLNAKTAGVQTPATAIDYPIGSIATNKLGVTEGASTGNAKTRLNSTNSYVIGVLSLENVPAGADTYKFVAIDGVSPDHAYDLTAGAVTADPYQRQSVAAGDYPFAYESFVVYKDNAYGTLATKLATQILDSTAHNLVGFAYEDLPGTWAAWKSGDGYIGNVNKQSRVGRAGNNLFPLEY
jgi:hypothetical protein